MMNASSGGRACVALALGAWALLSPAPSAAQPLSAERAEELLGTTLGRGDEDRRLGVRARIAAEAPDSAAGLFARRYLAIRAGRISEANQLRDECMQRFPRFEACADAHVAGMPTIDVSSLLDWARAHVVAGSLPQLLVERIYERAAAVDRQRAQAWARELEARHPRAIVFDLLRAQEVRGEDPQRAYEIIRAALPTREGAKRGALEMTMRLVSRELPLASPSARVRALVDLLGALDSQLSPDDLALAYFLAATEVRDHLQDRHGAAVLYQRSYAAQPSPSAAVEGFYSLADHEPPAARRILEPALQAFASHPRVLEAQGYAHAFAEYDPARSEMLYRQAIAAARDDVERRAIVLQLVNHLLTPHARDAEIVRELGAIPEVERHYPALYALYQARLRLGELDEAERLLHAYRGTLSSAREVWFLSQRERMGAYTVEPPPFAAPDALSIRFLAASRDGRYWSSGTDPFGVFDARTGRPRVHLRRGGAREFSPDGRFLATRSQYTELSGAVSHSLLVYEIPSGRLHRFLDMSEEIRDHAFSPDSRRVAVYDGVGFVTELDLTNGARRVARASSRRIGGALAYSADGRYLFASPAQERTVKVFRTDTLHVERELPGVDWAHSMTVTADNRYLVVADNVRRLTVYEIGTWAARSMRLDRTGRVMRAHPRLPVVLLSGGFRGESAAVIDIAAMQLVREIPMAVQGSAAFLGPRQIVVQRDDGIETLDYPSFRSRGVRRARERVGRGLVALGGTRVAVRLHDGLVVRDVITDRAVQRWPRPGDVQRRAGTDELIVVEERTLHRLDVRTGNDRTVELPVDFDVQSVSVGARLVAVAGVAGANTDGQRQTPARGTVAVLDLESGRLIWRVSVPIVTRPQRYPGLYRSALSVALDEGQSLVAVSSAWQDGYGHPIEHAREIRLYTVGNDALQRTIPARGDVHRVAVPAPGMVQAWRNADFDTYDSSSGSWIAGGQRRTELSGDRVLQVGEHRVEVLSADGRVLFAKDLAALVAGHEVLEDGSLAVLDVTGQLHHWPADRLVR